MKGWACVARFGGLGDNLIASSVMPLLAEQWNVEVMTKKPTGEVFENNPHIAKLSYKEDGDIPSGVREWRDWFGRRATEYEGGLFHLSNSCETLLAFGVGDAGFWWPEAWRRAHCNKSYLEAVHDICGVRYEFSPGFFPTAEERTRAAETKHFMGKRVIGWVLSGSRIDKVHPYQRSMVARLIRETDAAVCMFGAGARDFVIAQDIQEFVRLENGSDRGLHLALSKDEKAPNWPVRRSLTQVAACDVLVTPDSGLAWSVATAEMPKIIMVSHASPENVTKHWCNTLTLHADPERIPCWPCHRLHDSEETCHPNEAKHGAACISDISIETVVTAVKNALYGIPAVRGASAAD